MKNVIGRIAPAAALTAALIAVPAQAKRPDHAGWHGGDRVAEHGGKGHGKSGRCKAPKVGWVVKGTLVETTLVDNGDGTFGGDVVVTVTRTNKHARAEGDGTQPKTYTLTGVRASFDDLSDRNGDGVVGLGDVAAGDDVKLIGSIARAKKRCPAPETAAAATIRKVAFDAPEVETESDE